ncbi:A/G-specific adenine glycosylase [Pseudactinotalea sp. HY160]|nr:A/G-specific adenine glycosylase [Pseudactinotalea sp. HY160]
MSDTGHVSEPTAPLRPPHPARPPHRTDRTDRAGVAAPDPATPAASSALVRALTDWFDAHARPLPWRSAAGVRAAGGPRADHAWGVFLSEVMSQQTPISRVEPIWREWIRAWPTPADLAAATPAEVLRSWRHLGYPRRALRLLEAAAAITRDHGGRVPAAEADLLDLPGVGAYTAAAVSAFAFGRRSVVLDTNVRRVLGRVTGGLALPRPHLRRDEQRGAAALVPADPAAAATWNAAVMEFGALVCTAAAPDCSACPLTSCAWREAGYPADVFRRRRQSWAGSDRQARGRIMAQLRESPERTAAELAAGVPAAAPAGQHERALASLLADGLVAQVAGGYRLPS